MRAAAVAVAPSCRPSRGCARQTLHPVDPPTTTRGRDRPDAHSDVADRRLEQRERLVSEEKQFSAPVCREFFFFLLLLLQTSNPLLSRRCARCWEVVLKSLRECRETCMQAIGEMGRERRREEEEEARELVRSHRRRCTRNASRANPSLEKDLLLPVYLLPTTDHQLDPRADFCTASAEPHAVSSRSRQTDRQKKLCLDGARRLAQVCAASVGFHLLPPFASAAPKSQSAMHCHTRPHS